MTSFPNTNLTYLALGDSYTIGESVSQNDSFPFQLVNELAVLGLNFAAPKVIAKTGWTSSELREGIELAKDYLPVYDIVTLLIGVNNQYRGQSITAYRDEFKALLQMAIKFAGGNKKRVFVISIPDWGITAFGKASGRDQQLIAKEIDEFNAVNQAETLALGLSHTDITPDSRAAEADASLIADDGLHPSGKMYATWAAELAPKIRDAF